MPTSSASSAASAASVSPFKEIYNYPNAYKWQPYGIGNTEKIKDVEKAYVNYYTEPYSKEQYLKFINNILQGNPDSNSSKTELYELNIMLNNLADTLRIRALFQFNLTRSKVVADFINLIIKELEVDTSSDAIANVIPLPRDAKFADLILSDDEAQRGGKHSKKNKVKVVRSFVDNLVMKRIEGTDIKGLRKSSGTKREEANKEINASISQYKSLYKFEDLPKSFQEYYGKRNKGKTIDISNGCHVRMVPRKDY